MNTRITTLLLLFMKQSFSYPLFVPNNIRSQSTILSVCLDKIIKRNFKIDEYITFITERFVADDLYGEIVLGPKFVYSAENKGVTSFNLMRSRAYLIVLEDIRVENVMVRLSSLYSWNPRAKFVIVSSKEEPKEIFENMSKYYLANVAVLAERNDGVYIYTWSMYKKYCRNKLKIRFIEFCNRSGYLLQNATIFESKVPVTWEGCRVKILAAYIPPYVFFNHKKKELDGLEVRAFGVVQDKLKFSYAFLEHPFKTWGLKKADGIYSDMFGVLQKYEADVVMGMWPSNFTQAWDFDVSVAYLVDALVWLVPKAKMLPHWKRLSIIFSLGTWLSISASVFVFSLLWAAAGRILEDRESFRSWRDCLQGTFAVCLAVSVPASPRTSTLRILFVLWVYVSLILVTVYQSKLISILTQPQYYRQITNMEELLETGMDFGGNINVRSLFNDESSELETSIYRNYKVCDLTLSCPNRTAFSSDFATAKSKYPAEYLILQHYTNPDGSPMIHIFSSHIALCPVNIVFSKGHPLFDPTNRILLYLSESGIMSKWFDDIKVDKLRESFSNRQDFGKSSVELSLRHMIAPFLILILGHLIACVVFITEYFIISK